MKRRTAIESKGAVVEPKQGTSVTLIYSGLAAKRNEQEFPVREALTDSGERVFYNYRTYFDVFASEKAGQRMGTIEFFDKYPDSQIQARVRQVEEPKLEVELG